MTKTTTTRTGSSDDDNTTTIDSGTITSVHGVHKGCVGGWYRIKFPGIVILLLLFSILLVVNCHKLLFGNDNNVSLSSYYYLLLQGEYEQSVEDDITTISSSSLSTSSSTSSSTSLSSIYQNRSKHILPEIPEFPLVPSHYPHFILGHSTGHAASSSTHLALIRQGCPWNTSTTGTTTNISTSTTTSSTTKKHPSTPHPASILVERFEWTARGEVHWIHGNASAEPSLESLQISCQLAQFHVVPSLLQYIQQQVRQQQRQQKQRKWNALTLFHDDNTNDNLLHHNDNDDDMRNNNITFLDMGHFHNRGRVIECLCGILQHKLTLVRIRRNRHAIANSFASKFKTPCKVHRKVKQQPSPSLAVCPHSDEETGYVNLPVSDMIWDSFTPFQRFLWLADELEHRWYTLTKYFATRKEKYQQQQTAASSPTFIELTWSSHDDLSNETNYLRTRLGCSPLVAAPAINHHTKRQKSGTINCTKYIIQDWEYQRLMQYDEETLNILLLLQQPQQRKQQQQHPMHLDSNKCIESRDELETFIRQRSFFI